MRASNVNANDTEACEAREEIYRDLVDTLFGTPGSFAAGLVGGLIAPVSAWLMTGREVYVVLTIVMMCFAAYRLYVLYSHTMTPRDIRRRDAQLWEIRYGIGGVGFMTAVGVSVAILFSVPSRDWLELGWRSLRGAEPG